MNIAEWLSSAAGRWPAAPALLKGNRIDADYRTFAARAGSIATTLQDTYGIGHGDRVCLFMDNSTEYLECLYGIWWAGAVAVPIDSKLHSNEAHWIIGNAEPKLVLCNKALSVSLQHCAEFDMGVTLIDIEEKIDELRSGHGSALPKSCDDKDIAWLFYTSGTTGRPKGAMLSHGNLVAMSLCYPLDIDPPAQADASLYAAPLSHAAGLYNFIQTRVGARHVVPDSGGFQPDEILALASELRNVTMFAAPTMVRRLIRAIKAGVGDGDGIKTIVYGGAPMYLADIKEAVATLGPRFMQVYGQGESPMTISALSRTDHAEGPDQDRLLASVGYAHSVVSLRIVAPDGNTCALGETGEVFVKGGTVLQGYWRNPAATESAVVDGWLKTGDVGSLDANGLLTLSDRVKDVVITGGLNVYPREVEDVLLQHPHVQEVAIIGTPDAEWGEIVIACFSTGSDLILDEEELDTMCLENLARFKRPKRYVQLASLPKSNAGKILKKELRRMLADGTPQLVQS